MSCNGCKEYCLSDLQMRILDFGQPVSAAGGKPCYMAMAEILLGSHCMGIDLSPKQIACGHTVVQVLNMPIVLVLRRSTPWARIAHDHGSVRLP